MLLCFHCDSKKAEMVMKCDLLYYIPHFFSQQCFLISCLIAAPVNRSVRKEIKPDPYPFAHTPELQGSRKAE